MKKHSQISTLFALLLIFTLGSAITGNLYSEKQTQDVYLIPKVAFGTNNSLIELLSDAAMDTFFTSNTTTGTSWADAYVLEDLVFDGEGNRTCIEFRDTNRYVKIVGCTFTNAQDSQTGIFLLMASNVFIINCTFTDCDTGILAASAENNSVFNCDFEGSEYGVQFFANDYGNLTECYFTNNDIAIQIQNGIDNLAANNVVDSNNWGIRSYLGENTQILNNTICNIAEDGILINEVSVVVLNSILVAGNEISDISRAGINVEMRGCTIENNTITRTGSIGIDVKRSLNIIFNNTITATYIGMYATASNSEFTNNTISDAERDGMQFGATYATSEYLGNHLYGCGFVFHSPDEGFVLDKTNTVNDKPVAYYVNNASVTISSTDMYGQIILDNCSNAVLDAVGVSGMTIKNSPSITVTNCDVAGLSIGIEIFNCSNGIIDFCSVSSTHYEGIHISSSNYFSILNSVISNSPFRGVSLYQSDFVNISDCTIQNSGDMGIRVQLSSDLTISNCAISNSGADGIALSGSSYNTISSTTIDTTAGTGIYGWDDCLDLEIEDCVVTNNPFYGISLRLSDFDLVNNTIENNGYYGILIDNDLISDPHHVYIANNTIRNAETGIALLYVSETAGDILILGNLIEECDFGIDEMFCNSITVDYNTFQNCGMGIKFGGMHDIFIRYNTFNFCDTGMDVGEITNIEITHNFINMTSIGINYYELSGIIQSNTIYYYDECITGYSTLTLDVSDNTCTKVQPPVTPTGTDPTGTDPTDPDTFNISGFAPSSFFLFGSLAVSGLLVIFGKKRKQ